MAQTVAVRDQPAPAPIAAPVKRRSAKRIFLRVAADAVAVSSALFIASILRFELGLFVFDERAPAEGVDYTILTLALTPIWLVLFWMYGLYEPRQVLSPVNEFKQ